MSRNVFVFGLCLVLGACGSDSENPSSEESENSAEPALTEASAETQALWADLSGYASWSQFPEATERKQSESHQDMWVLSYYNDTVGTAMDDGTLPLPDGSIIVKENYKNEDDAEPMVLTVMSKISGQWYWVKGTPDGQVFMGPDGPLEGKNVQSCVMCHGAASDNDFVMTHTF